MPTPVRIHRPAASTRPSMLNLGVKLTDELVGLAALGSGAYEWQLGPCRGGVARLQGTPVGMEFPRVALSRRDADQPYSSAVVDLRNSEFWLHEVGDGKVVTGPYELSASASQALRKLGLKDPVNPPQRAAPGRAHRDSFELPRADAVSRRTRTEIAGDYGTRVTAGPTWVGGGSSGGWGSGGVGS